jgi:benzoyl-CoA reductase/2-hydroxyglutaryl-CoA dehydratase subunit BcrC/BadD/HgdB
MKQTSALLILLIAMALSVPCTIYSQALPVRDTLVSLTTEQVRSLLKLKVERDYLKAQVGLLTKSDSISSFVIKDQAKTIDQYTLLNERMASNLSAAQEELSKQSARKESWRSVALIGIPISFVGGIIFTILF